MENSRWIAGFGTLFFALAGCGGGGGEGGGGGGGNGAPVARNLAPSVTTEAFIVGSAGQAITLMADGSDPEGDALTYRWTQTGGSDVIDTQGVDTASMSFRPSGNGLSIVETLSFSVEVSDGRVSDTAFVDVLVTKDATRATFVDGVNGSDDTGIGSIEMPYKTIDYAAENGAPGDIYVRSLPNDGVYAEDTYAITLVNGESLFGGFDENWNRDVVGNKTIITTRAGGIRMLGSTGTSELSGVDVTATLPQGHNDSSTLRETLFVRAVHVLGDNDVIIKHNVLTSESAVPQIGYNLGGSSLAVKADRPNSIEITDNVIIAGNGSDALGSPNTGALLPFDRRMDSGSGGLGGDEWGENGNKGNDAPVRSSQSCSRGGAGGSGEGAEGGNGGSGERGCHGADGANGAGGTGFGQRSSLRDAGFANSRGGDGEAGVPGMGGGGGGGGEAANGVGLDGGDGGTGGLGGKGAAISPGSFSGGASIGIEINGAGRAVLRANNILTGNGAAGGDSAGKNYGQDGASGTDGGKGKKGNLNDGGDGGKGGTGGNGGDSGWAGAGGGGPSFAVVIGDVTQLDIRENIFETGNGGIGGAPYTSSRRPAGLGSHTGYGGWSVGIFHWDASLSLVGISDNTYLLGEAGSGGEDFNPAFRAGVTAEIANPETPLPSN